MAQSSELHPSSSSESGAPGPPSRLVPGHRLWASRHGPHVLGLIQDHHALRKQISEGRRLTQHMDAQLQEGRPHLRVGAQNMHQHAKHATCTMLPPPPGGSMVHVLGCECRSF